MRIHLITVIGSHVELLPHMLAHYREEIDFDSLLVNINLESMDDPLYGRIVEVCRQYGARIFSVYAGPWLEHVNTFLYAQARQIFTNDWFVLADLDEFQLWPNNTRSLLEEIDRDGYQYVEGCVIDRLAADGAFPPIRSDVSIWKQFPLAGSLTYPLTRGAIQKVAAVKGNLTLAGGQHMALGGRGYPRERLYIPVHHFKWTEGVYGRLVDRVKFFQSTRQRFWEHFDSSARYIEAHGGRINISDPELMLAPCVRDYPHWETLKRLLFSKLAELKTPKAALARPARPCVAETPATLP